MWTQRDYRVFETPHAISETEPRGSRAERELIDSSSIIALVKGSINKFLDKKASKVFITKMIDRSEYRLQHETRGSLSLNVAN